MTEDLVQLPPDHPTVNPELHLLVLAELEAAGKVRRANFDPQADKSSGGRHPLAAVREKTIADYQARARLPK